MWSLLQDSLRTLPVEDLTANREVLIAAGKRVATALTSSLETIGFRYEDIPAETVFYITRFDFPDE